MKTLDEVLTKYGHNWLLHSLKDQDCQVVHLVDVGALQDCLRGSPKVQGRHVHERSIRSDVRERHHRLR